MKPPPVPAAAFLVLLASLSLARAQTAAAPAKSGQARAAGGPAQPAAPAPSAPSTATPAPAPEDAPGDGSPACATAAARRAEAGYAEAEKLAQARVRELEQQGGPEAPGTLRARLLAEEIACDLSHEAAAVPRLRTLLAGMQRVLGAEHRATLACQADLALALATTGGYTEAVRQCRAILPAATRVLGAQHRTTLRARRALAAALAELRKTAEAAQEAHATAEACTRALGAEDGETLQARLAPLTMTFLRNDPDPTPQLQELQPLLGRILGPEHRATLLCQTELALHAQGGGDTPDADTGLEELLRRALAAQTRVLGADDLDTLRTRTFIIDLMDEQPDRRDDAEREDRAVLLAQERLLRPEDRAPMLFALSGLADCLMKQEKYPEAEQEIRRLIALSTNVSGPEDGKTLRDRLGLAEALEAQGRDAEALQEQRAVLGIRERVLGPEAAETLSSLHNLAWALRQQKQHPEALALAERALAGRLKTLGAESSPADDSRRLVNMLTYTVAPHLLRTRTRADETLPPLPHDHPVAMVKGALIMKSDVEDYIRTQEIELRYEHRDDTEPAVLEKELARMRREALGVLIDQQILIDRFRRMGGVMKPKYVDQQIESIVRDSFHGDAEALKAELKRNGTPYERFRRAQRMALITSAMRQKLAGDISAEEYEAREYFEAHKQLWTDPGEVKFHTLSLPRYSTHKSDDELRRYAESARARLAAGADMVAMAGMASQDSHAENGGAWDWMPLTQLMPHLRAALEKLKKGGLSPVLQEETTYIIVRLDDRRPGAVPRYEDHREEARMKLEIEMRKEHIRKKIEDMRPNAEVQYLDSV